MGRSIKYKSTEEKLQAQRKWALEYYHKNKEEVNRKTMKKYYAKKK
jgi:hypothetical protein